jgi:hypothetical protein
VEDAGAKIRNHAGWGESLRFDSWSFSVSWNAPNSKRVPARVKKVHVPKPVLSDAVALKDRPGPEETALRWIGASVVAEQELVLA